MHRFSPVELAVGVALIGSGLAVAVPAFIRDLHASRLVEPIEGLSRLGASAVEVASVDHRFPDSAPLTPAVPPRGHKEVDPPGTWETPTWRALAFRPSAEGVAHAFSFSFDSAGSGSVFVAQARGDLDGDGISSTFEIRGLAQPGETPVVTPGMTIDAELE